MFKSAKLDQLKSPHSFRELQADHAIQHFRTSTIVDGNALLRRQPFSISTGWRLVAVDWFDEP